MALQRLQAVELVGGSARGELLHANVGLSFWGGVDPLRGTVIDHTHPLHGRCVSGKVLAVPNGRGSCTGSQVMLELILNDIAPLAILLRQPDAILALGIIVAEELFGKSIPLVSLGEEGFAAIAQAEHVAVEGALVLGGACSEQLASARLDNAAPPSNADALLASSRLRLTSEERSMLQGARGEAASVAMRILARAGAIDGAPSLLEISQAHIDGCTYIGPGGLRFAQTLAQLGGSVAVPTTLNSNSVDRRRWRALGVSPALGEPAYALGDAYLQMGCSDRSFTCAPYLLDSAPGLGEQIAWGESNAVVYANSVLGARTQKYADYLDICAAITGRVPKAGAHLDEARVASVLLDVGVLAHELADQCEDAFWPVLGYLCGLRSEARVPVLVGLEGRRIGTDELKAFSAAFGSTASVPMFHIAGVTPEAPDAASALGHLQPVQHVVLTQDDLAAAWRALDSGYAATSEAEAAPLAGQQPQEQAEGHAVELVAVGNPHLSLGECRTLSELCASSAPKQEGVSVVATLGRVVYEQAEAAGYAAAMRAFGVQFVTDTCWCMLTEPVVPISSRTLITNSAKYAHYAPGLVNRRVRFGTLAGCIEAASTARAPPRPAWVSQAVGQRRGFTALGAARCVSSAAAGCSLLRLGMRGLLRRG